MTTTISGSGAHGTAEATDRIPASKAGVKGYLTLTKILEYIEANIDVEGGDMSAAEILAALITVDGASSGLDADLLDGNHAAAFALTGHDHTGTYQPLDSDLTAVAALSPSNDDILQRKSGAWTNRTIAQLLTDLGLAALYQPLDGDLTSIAGLSTTAGGRALLTMSDPGADRILFWDESANAFAHLTVGTGLAITDTTIEATGGGGGGIGSVVEDTTPQLGGDLDLNSQDITGTGGIDISGTIEGTGLGAGATPDGTNVLSVVGHASLLNHDGNGHQVKVNKAAAGDTASFLFQTGFSGRAEFGTTGDDDFHVKVSPDGSTWYEGMVIDKDNGRAKLLVTEVGSLELGNASDTTLARSAAGVVSVEGNVLAFREPGIVSDATTSKTLALTDAGKIVEMTSGSANDVVIPANASIAFPVGTMINVTQYGAGVTTIDADTGVTLNGVSGGEGAISARYGSVSLYKRDTNEWVMSGAHGAVA